MRMLHGLAGQPEILNTVAVLPARRADLSGQIAEYVACDCIYNDEGLASNSVQRGEAPLAGSRLARNFSSKSEFGDSDRRQIYRLVVGESRDVGWGQKAAFYVNPDARID